MNVTYTAPISCASTTTTLTYQNTEGGGTLRVYTPSILTATSTENSIDTLIVPNGTYTVAISTNCSTSLTHINVDGISTTVPSSTTFYTTVTFDGSHTIACTSTCIH